MNQKAFEKVLKLSEEFFGSTHDPEQMPINQASADKLASLHPDCVVYKFDEHGDPVAWVVIVPTSTRVMEDFLAKKISERELLDVAAEEKKFDALYLCGAFVLPEYRRKGYVKELALEGIKKVSGGKDLPLYGWIYSSEGEKLADSVSLTLGKKIKTRSDP